MPDIKEKLVELLNAKVYDDWYSNEEIADHLIANGVTIQRWISVEDRLPDDDVEVLTMRATGMSIESQCGNGWWFFDEYNGENGVTHWMPLPEQPKGE